MIFPVNTSFLLSHSLLQVLDLFSKFLGFYSKNGLICSKFRHFDLSTQVCLNIGSHNL